MIFNLMPQVAASARRYFPPLLLLSFSSSPSLPPFLSSSLSISFFLYFLCFPIRARLIRVLYVVSSMSPVFYYERKELQVIT